MANRNNQLLSYFNLDAELDDFDVIHETITRDMVFRGTNLWILMFAIVIASVGLNVNSTAVIIGAMLISPLMGPINGMGYSVATYNISLFKLALKNYIFAVVASLVASTMYFLLSPISSAQSELLARTNPTIYDVIIALFGGLAGIVAISTKMKGNVIPGVAIATALMPPICTAGYGLARGQFDYFWGAMYLFTINTVFIAISSVVVSQLLRFPIRNVDEQRRKNINRVVTVIIIIIVVPSVFFGYQLVQKERFSESARNFIGSVSFVNKNYLLSHEINQQKGQIALVYGGTTMNDADKLLIKNRCRDFGLDTSQVYINQGLVIESENAANLAAMKESERLSFENFQLNLNLKEQERLLDSLRESPRLGEQLLQEIRVLYPNITACTFAESLRYEAGRDTLPAPQQKVVIFTSTQKLQPKDTENITSWLKTRLKDEQARAYFDITQVAKK